MSFSSICSYHYWKNTNNDNKICPLESSANFQQNFRYNLYLKKLEWTPPWTKFVICQIHTNCPPFQSLNMLPFHIRPECLKLTYCSLIWFFSRYYFKTGILCLLFLSSHVFPALGLNSNCFGILLWKILKPSIVLVSYFEK